MTTITRATSDDISTYDITTIEYAASDEISIYDVTTITCATSDDISIFDVTAIGEFAVVPTDKIESGAYHKTFPLI